LIRFTISNHIIAEVVEITFEVLGIIVTVQGFFMTTIEPWYTYTSSALLPVPAIGWIMQLGIIAFNKNIDVELF